VPVPSNKKPSFSDNIKQSFQGWTVKIIFGLLCLVFALQFGGPQAQGCSGGQTAYAAKVWGNTITEGDFRAAYLLAGGDQFQPEMAEKIRLKSLVLNGLVERTLLARQARKLDFRVDEEAVLQTLAEDGTVYVSLSTDAPVFLQSGPRKIDFTDKDGNFDKEHLRRFIMYQMHRSVTEFAESQAEETLAQTMRDVVTSSVDVSSEEIWEGFLRENEKVTLKYLRFSPIYYRDKLEPSEPQIDRWSATHQAEVDAAYQRERHNYTGLEKQVRARHILIKVAADASPQQKEAAKKRALELLKQAKQGASFETLAAKYSQDPGSARRGGDLGYNPRGRMVTRFDEVQFSLKPGEISDLVETDFGFHIIKAEGVRQGDVPVTDAKREVARNLWLDSVGGQQAKQEAEKALAQLLEGTDIDALSATLAKSVSPSSTSTPDGSENPTESDPLAPQVRETMPFSRVDLPIHGPFDSRPLVEKAFGLTLDKPLPVAPIQLGEDWFVYRLKEHTSAKRDAFSGAERERVRNRLLAAKRRDVLGGYVRGLLKEAQAANAIHFNESVSVEPNLE
jgi:peptidyl-prolyl cis-trans isomerase D